eukprot:43379-Chlamydomonas_euryale.AAC.1
MERGPLGMLAPISAMEHQYRMPVEKVWALAPATASASTKSWRGEPRGMVTKGEGCAQPAGRQQRQGVFSVGSAERQA